ncbi:MAG: magnesium transporter [Clostridia bacterium]|nr:magnesium transporter [Clostridia bacterium]
MDEMKLMMEQILEYLHSRQFTKLQEYLETINPADIAEVMEELLEDEEITHEELPLIFRILPKELASDTFIEMETDMQEVLITAFSDTELREVMGDIFLDDTVDIIEEMPANVVTRILKNVGATTRKNINQILNYPEDSAGSIMTIEYVALKPDYTVEESFKHIRETGVNKETIYICYVVDQRSLIGLVSVKDLLLSQADERIADIMEKNVISVTTTDDKEDVARSFYKYEFTALPVVDNENRLVGIVTFDDAMEVMQEEATEDMERMAAILPSGKAYLKAGVVDTWKQRIPWLMLMMVSATFTSMIITRFESALTAQVILTAFIPMLMGTGGNSANQACVTIIRGLSLGDIEFEDILEVIWKEIRVSVLCGASLASVNFAKLIYLDHIPLNVAAVVSLTLVGIVFVAKLVGCTLPLFASRTGLDPAVMASPFISTIVDAISLLIYFMIATAALGL